MLTVYVPRGTTLEPHPIAAGEEIPEAAVWLDLFNPTVEEDKLVEQRVGVAVPTREEMQEIEISSRLYVENGARYMTATLMSHSDTATAGHHAGLVHPCRSAAGDGSLRRAAAVCDDAPQARRASVRATSPAGR